VRPRLEGKVVIVTGSARGIGRGIAQAMAAEGAVVVVADRDGAAGEGTAAEIGPPVVAVQVDVADEASVAALARTVEERHGRIDVLVNNAGIATSARVAEMSLAMWAETIAVDLTGVFLCCRAVLPGMIARGAGRIVNIGSQLGLRGAPALVHYSAAKAGVHGLTKALAREVAPHGITVNAIAPGPIDTEILAGIDDETMAGILAEIPLGRLGLVEEIAPTAVLLASDEGSYYTGSVLNVSGGHVM
jgi:3-oxoacyl-[acyl-carrier protein] reductase